MLWELRVYFAVGEVAQNVVYVGTEENTLLLYVVFREADLACADSTSLPHHSSGSDLILYIVDFKFE